MKKLREIIPLNEIFDSHYPFTHNQEYKPREGSTNVTFTSKNNQKYGVSIRNGFNTPKHAIVDFANHTHNSTELTNSEPNEAHKIFGTVKKIIHHHIEKNPHTETLEFESKNSEPTRTKLYHKFAKSIDPNYKHESGKYDTTFNVKVK